MLFLSKEDMQAAVAPLQFALVAETPYGHSPLDNQGIAISEGWSRR